MKPFFKFSIFFFICAVLAFSQCHKISASQLSAPFSPSDPDALPCASQLLLFLQETAKEQRVIFGHQNDTNLTIRPGILSDVEDLTGDISGIVGLDTLDLTGNMLGSQSQTEGLQKSIQISVDAAQRGALITLSAHMPNFGSPHIQELPDGSYNFIHCQLADAKDVSSSCARECLPGGDYHTVFNAYLDLIAEYGLKLQEHNIPVLFRPFHEGNGGWFWWGTSADNDTYVSLYRYTRDYLTAKNIHNFLYVYSPNGPIASESSYLERYPGDSYVDILAVDYYNGGYDTLPLVYNDAFFRELDNTCQILSAIATAHGKIPAISETGIWIRATDIPDQDGLLEYGNPMTDHGWYQKVGQIAIANHMPYYLVWMNACKASFHVPFRYDNSHSHEMAGDFINFYKESSSLFANDLHFYEKLR